jgi:predicted permease
MIGFDGTLSDGLLKALTSTALYSSVITCLAVIFLGYFLARKSLLPKSASSVLTKIVLDIALPCLAFVSFMSDFTASGAIDTIVNLLLGFALYGLFIAIGEGLFAFVKDRNRRKILALLFAFGSGTFFAQPMLASLYGDQAFNDSNLLNIAFRVFVYSYVYLQIGGKKIAPEETSKKAIAKKILLNPILIGTFLGLLFWSLQALPGSAEAQWWTLRKDWLNPSDSGPISYVPFWRFDVSLPWINTTLKVLGALSSPLIYLAIGLTLGEKSLAVAAKNGLAWFFAIAKIVIAPALVLGILYLLEAIAKAASYPMLISLATVQSTVLMWAVPPVTVGVAYCLEFDNEKDLASEGSLLATILFLPMVIFWVLILALVGASGYFYVA